MYSQKRTLFTKLLQDSRFTLLPSEGTYFQIVNYEGVSELNDMEFAQELIIKHKCIVHK